MGYDVYWPAIQNGPVDFLVRRGRWYRRVQVKTANVRFNSVRVHTHTARYAHDPFDDLVVVHHAQVWRIPWSKVSHLPSLNMSKRKPLF